MIRNLILAISLTCFISACGGKTKEELYAEGVKQLNSSNPGGAIVLLKNALEKDENFIDARFQLAKAYMASGKHEQAEREFSKVLKLNPTRDDITLELAKINIALKKTDEAFRLAEQYLAKHPDSAEALEVMGISCAVGNRLADAESYLLKAMAADPKRSKTRIELAGLYLAGGKVQQAKGLLDELVKTDKENTKAYYMLAAIEKNAGNSDKALEIYKRIQEINRDETLAEYKSGLIYIEKNQLDLASASAERLVKSYPKKADGHRLKGLVSYQQKNYADAMLSLQTSIKIMPNIEAFYFLGLSYYNRGEYESALSQFRKILDVVPSSRQARLMTGNILLAQKRVDDAIDQFSKVIKDNDNDAVAHNMLGSAYMSKGMFEEGMRELNRATKIDPKIVDAHLKKGYYYFSRGKNSEGESELATAVQAAPDVLNSRLLLASYHMSTGKTAKAMATLNAGLTGGKGDAPIYNSIAAVQFAEKKQDEALKSIQKAKQVDPAFAGSYQNLATYHAASGNYDKAIEEYQAWLKNDPSNHRAMLGLAVLYEIKGSDSDALSWYNKAKETKKPGVYLALAGYHQKKKDSGKALKVLDEAIKLDAKDLAALEMKGRILVTEKKYKDAIKTFEELETKNSEKGIALKINTYVAMKETDKALEQGRRIVAKYPGSAQGYMVMASIYESQKDYGNAIKEMNNGVRVDANNPQALLYLGNLYEAKKDYSQAMSSYSEAYRKKADFVPALFAQGALLDSTGKKKEAIEKYKAVLAKSGSYAPALNNLSYLYSDGYGSRDEALRLAISAFKAEPGNPGVMDTLGYALYKNGRNEDAKKVLERAVKLLPGNPTVNYHMALVYKELGDKANARQSAEKALSLGAFPDSGAAQSLLAELKK
jgi:putative PEP-CTERM system TPR-repeat lipoprotein